MYCIKLKLYVTKKLMILSCNDSIYKLRCVAERVKNEFSVIEIKVSVVDGGRPNSAI